LYCVAPYHADPNQFESSGRERTIRGLINVSHHIHFAFTPSARAGTPQFLESDKGFAPIFPFYGELSADRLNVNGPH
jgi:hypothetical protein